MLMPCEPTPPGQPVISFISSRLKTLTMFRLTFHASFVPGGKNLVNKYGACLSVPMNPKSHVSFFVSAHSQVREIPWALPKCLMVGFLPALHI